MKKIHGITATPDGTYVRISAVKKSSGWKIIHNDSWQIGNIFRNSLLFNSHIHYGIESHWVRQLPSESDHLLIPADSSFVSPCVHASQHSFHVNMLEKNLKGVYPDDAYLCTLPLYLLNKPEDSFISIHKDETIIKIGIILQRKLCAVYSLPSLLFAQLNGFLERIRRYWTTANSDNLFPSRVYTFNKQDVDPGAPFNTHSIDTPVKTPAQMKSLGVAFCALEPAVPMFSGSSKSSSLAPVRTAVYSISMAMILFVATVTGVIFYKNYRNSKDLVQYEIDYKNILNNNNEIRTLTQAGELLARKLIRIEKFAASPTQWSKFLTLIGADRPQSLYFERVGSESKQTKSNTIKIALTGWADSETTVTDLIQKMNKSSLIENITLSSLERDSKYKNTQFKILCNVNLLKN